MQIHKSVNETEEQFRARAFRWNRLVGEAFARRQARYKPITKAEIIVRDAPSWMTCATPVRASGATPVDRKVLRTFGMLPDAPAPLRGVSRVRACWYGSGLVFGVVCIAMAVFGMGQ